MPDRASPIIVTAAVIERDGCFLLTKRIHGTHLAGRWEFPGGKCGADEDPADCLEREIREELNAPVRIGSEILRTSYRYPDRDVELRFFRCTLLGEPTPLLGQEIRWVTRADLATLEFPPADRELVDLLRAEGV